MNEIQLKDWFTKLRKNIYFLSYPKLISKLGRLFRVLIGQIALNTQLIEKIAFQGL